MLRASHKDDGVPDPKSLTFSFTLHIRPRALEDGHHTGVRCRAVHALHRKKIGVGKEDWWWPEPETCEVADRSREALVGGACGRRSWWEALVGGTGGNWGGAGLRGKHTLPYQGETAGRTASYHIRASDSSCRPNMVVPLRVEHRNLPY